MINVTLRNSFHNTKATVRVPSLPAMITHRQYLNACAKLCAGYGCRCGGVFGPQDVLIEEEMDKQGQITVILTAREEAPNA